MPNMIDVIGFEVRRTVRKRSFWVASLVPPLLILAVFGISYASDHTANQQQAQVSAKTDRLGILDQSGLVSASLISRGHITIEVSKDAGIEAVKQNRLDAFLYYPSNVASAGIEIYEQDHGLTFAAPYSDQATALLQESVGAHVARVTGSPQAVELLEQTPNVTTTTYKNGAVSNGLASIIAPGVLMLAFLMLVALLASLMISSTTEEKENRVAEILLTSIKPKTLILGKIASIFVMGGIQIMAIIVPLVIAYVKFKSQLSLPGGVSITQIPLNGGQILLGVAFLLLGLLMFTGILVGLGAMFPGANDAARFLGIMILWAFLPLYTLRYIISSPNSLIVSVFSYFPLTAPTMGLLRNTLGTMTVEQALPVLAILIVSSILAVMFAVRAFTYGATEYSRRIGFRELFR